MLHLQCQPFIQSLSSLQRTFFDNQRSKYEDQKLFKLLRSQEISTQCKKFGHVAKYCRAENETRGICSADHSSEACPHCNEPFLTCNDRHTKIKKCSNCSNRRKYQHSAFSRGSMRKSNCPLCREQCLRLKQRIDYGNQPTNQLTKWLGLQKSTTQPYRLRCPVPSHPRCKCGHSFHSRALYY